jgi:DNA-binding NarL/FixJ family response regulator
MNAKKKKVEVDDSDPIEAGIRRLNLKLSETLRYVLAMLCAGRSNEEIAAEINVSVRTAKNYVGRLLEQTRTSTRTALVAEVLAGGNNVSRGESLAKVAWRAAARERGQP